MNDRPGTEPSIRPRPKPTQAPRLAATGHQPVRLTACAFLFLAMPASADPVLVTIPAGNFVLGAEAPRQGPPIQMDMPAFDITANEITVGDYRAFVAATGYQPPAGCFDWQDGGFADIPDGRWDDPRQAPSDAHPAVCIRWADAVAYADWLSATSGARWRLPTEIEWEYAAKGGDPAPQPLTPAGACAFANLHDATSAQSGGPGLAPLPCDDRYAKTAPVGGRSPNGFGLHDSLGNVTEWTGSCWRDAHNTPDADCSRHVARGGAWKDDLAQASTTSRVGLPEDFRSAYFGFRLVRER